MGAPSKEAQGPGHTPKKGDDADIYSTPKERQPVTKGDGSLRADSPLLGGPLTRETDQSKATESPPPYEVHPDVYEFPTQPVPSPRLRDLSGLLASPDPERNVDDWGRSERIYGWVEPLLNFYYRYWFRVETSGIEHIPETGGALLVSNHSGALPPDAPMIMQAIRNEHPHPRPLYMLGEHWFKGYPGVGMLVNKIGLVPAHPANAMRLLADEGQLALVFPEGQKGTRKLFWQRYHLRRFGRGGFVATAIRAQVPIVPVAVMGAEEAMPIFAHLSLLQRLTGLIYVPMNHALPHLGPAGALMHLPAKFKIRFLEPVSFDEIGPEAADDSALVQNWADEIRARVQGALEEMLRVRKSVWFG